MSHEKHFDKNAYDKPTYDQLQHDLIIAQDTIVRFGIEAEAQRTIIARQQKEIAELRARLSPADCSPEPYSEKVARIDRYAQDVLHPPKKRYHVEYVHDGGSMDYAQLEAALNGPHRGDVSWCWVRNGWVIAWRVG